MNIIEQLGGYEKAKAELHEVDGILHVYSDELRQALLEYRRQHNIFEVGDKVVYVDEFMHDEISAISSIDGRAWLNNDAAVCILEMIRHATPEEIKAGKRV